MVWDTMAFQEETNPGHTAANLHYIASQIQEEKIRENYQKKYKKRTMKTQMEFQVETNTNTNTNNISLHRKSA